MSRGQYLAHAGNYPQYARTLSGGPGGQLGGTDHEEHCGDFLQGGGSAEKRFSTKARLLSHG